MQLFWSYMHTEIFQVQLKIFIGLTSQCCQCNQFKNIFWRPDHISVIVSLRKVFKYINLIKDYQGVDKQTLTFKMFELIIIFLMNSQVKCRAGYQTLILLWHRPKFLDTVEYARKGLVYNKRRSSPRVM